MLWVPKEMPQIQLRKCRWRFLDQWIFLLHIFIGQSFLLKSKFCMLQLIRFGPNRRLLLHRPYWQFILPFSKTNTVPLLPIKCLPWKRINKFLLLSGGKDFCSISINHDSLFHRKRKHGGGKDSSFVAFGDFLMYCEFFIELILIHWLGVLSYAVLMHTEMPRKVFI